MTNDFGPGDRKAVIKHLASAAALDQISQSLSLRQPRAPCHPALRRRIIAAAVLGTLTLVAPGIPSATPAPRKEVRVPRIHATAIENL